MGVIFQLHSLASTLTELEGIRYPIGSAEINKHQIGFSLSSDEGMLEVDTT